MRSWRSICFFVALTVVSCGGKDGVTDATADDAASAEDASRDIVPGDGGETGDAGPNFSCSTEPYPTTAPTTVTFGGRVADPFTGAGIGGVTLTGMRQSDDSVLASVVTESDGSYSVVIETGGTAIPAYVRATKPAHLTTLDYGPGPVHVDNANFIISMVTPAELAAAAALAGVTLDENMGNVGVAITDCEGKGIAGATVSFDPPPGKVVYIAGSAPSPAATATDASGAVYAFNQPPGVVDATATCEGRTVRPYRLKVARGAVTAAQAMPRPFE